ncbi:type IV toxin-antitoxin system AbiEi family antitoxin domain-containing protein [Mesorhizobium sp. M1340]
MNSRFRFARTRRWDRNSANATGTAGGPTPTLRELAVALPRERGEVRTAELTAIGIPRCYLSRMCDEGLLVKVGYGRYRAVLPKAA